MISSSHEVVTKRKVSIPSFLSWSPSIAHTLSYWIMRYIVQGGFCPWFRGGCTASSSKIEIVKLTYLRQQLHSSKGQAIPYNRRLKLTDFKTKW